MTYVLGYPLTLECALRYARDHRIRVTPGKESDTYHEVTSRISKDAGLPNILAMVCWVRGKCELVYALHIDYHAKTSREARLHLKATDLPPMDKIDRLMESLYLDEDPKWWRYEDNVCPMPGDPDYTEEDNDYWCEEYDQMLEQEAIEAEERIYAMVYDEEKGVTYVYERYQEGVEYAEDAEIVNDDDILYQCMSERIAESVECEGEGPADDGERALPSDVGLVEDDHNDDEDDSSTERGEDEQDIAARVLVVQEEDRYAEKGIQADFSEDLDLQPDVIKLVANLHGMIIDTPTP